MTADEIEKNCANADYREQKVKSRRSGVWRSVVYLLNVVSWIGVVKLHRNRN